MKGDWCIIATSVIYFLYSEFLTNYKDLANQRLVVLKFGNDARLKPSCGRAFNCIDHYYRGTTQWSSDTYQFYPCV